MRRGRGVEIIESKEAKREDSTFIDQFLKHESLTRYIYYDTQKSRFRINDSQDYNFMNLLTKIFYEKPQTSSAVVQ